MSLEKSELIEKLGVISARYKDVMNVRNKMGGFVPEDIYIRQIVVPEFPTPPGGESAKERLWNEVNHSGTDEETINSLTWQYEGAHRVPQPPEEPANEPFSKPGKPASISILLGVAVMAVIAAVLYFFINFSAFLEGGFETIIQTIICSAIVVGAVVLFISSFIASIKYKKKVKIARTEFEQNQENLANKYREELSQYEYDIAAFRQAEQEYINEYWVWRSFYLEHLAEEERVREQLAIDREEALKVIEENELIPAEARLDEANDILSGKYLIYIDTLISLISNGRADTLKEAINLHEEILYRESLEIEREIMEEQRRREEEERRFAEERKMLERQEQARQEEEGYRRHLERCRQREEARERELQEYSQQEKARREESRRKHEETAAMYRDYHATQRQCQSCANMTHCRMAFQRSNCASYVPK